MSQDETQAVQLTTKGFAHLPLNCYENDFTFIVGEHEYRCSSVLADFLSPRVARLHSNDPTIREFIVDVSDTTGDFNSILSLGSGSPLPVSDSNLDFFLRVARALLNSELFHSLCAIRGGDARNCVHELQFCLERGVPCDLDSLLEKCSSSFFELPESSLSELSVSLLGSILSHPSLQIVSEDNLYEFVKSLVLRDESYSILLEFVRFEYLSLDSIRDFTQLISDSFSLLTPSIWGSLIHRLNVSVSPSPIISDRYYIDSVRFCEDRPLDGIVSLLTRTFRGNIHDLGVVTVSASSQQCSDCGVAVLVDFSSGLRGFATLNQPDSWICIDFKTRCINPTHYSVRTRTDGDSCHPRSWILEGSNDGETWIPLDSRENNRELSGLGCVKTFSTANPRFVRSIRIRQTGYCSASNDHLVFKSLEFFGSLGVGLPPA
jgi:hypothetical protein